MEILLALFILACVQALAEFLPISSSGHLVLIEHLPWMSAQKKFIGQELSLFTNVMLHVATLIAVLIYLRRDIAYIAIGVFKSIKQRNINTPDVRTVVYVFVASLPAGFIGILLHHEIESLFSSPTLVSAMLVVNGMLLLATRYIKIRHRFIGELGIWRALFIGVCQAFAIVPGISRSGLTIAGGFLAGLEPIEAAKFSFFMAIPVIAGAGILESVQAAKAGLPGNLLLPLFFAMVFATILALGALSLLVHVVRKIRIDLFGYYTIAVGIAGLVYYRLCLG
ncbi:MAG: undecaprenyl-diphosphate phosphatase [Spirochaetes bacterium]|nr:undecaprenyl-diphosphate phosphatase [Spirochaetota bacterium]